MDIRLGYKQSEVGMIPDDWEVVRLCELSKFKNGLNKAKRFFGTGTPIVNYMDVFERPGLRTDDLSGRVNLSPEEIRNYEVRQGDVFFTRTSETVEEVGVASVMLDNPHDTVFSGFVLRARPHDGRLNDDFKQYCFASNTIRSQIVSSATYTTRALTNGRALSAVWIAIPPKPEQRAIAEALSDADALIESLEQLLTKKRQLKKGAMQELLTGKKRLPGFSGEWEVKRLGELGSTFGGLTGKTKNDFGRGTCHYITFMNIMTNVVIDCSTFELVDVHPTESQNRVAKGDLFFNGSSETPEEVGMCAILTQDVQYVYLNSFCFGFRFRDGAPVDSLYITLFFRSQEGRKLLKSLAQGATRYNLSKTALLNISFPFPQPPEQAAIATILSDMDAEIVTLEAKLSKVHQLKQGMMQELLTGKIRLI